MKIAFVLPGDGVAGGVRVTVVTANYLLERGHEVRLLCFKPPRTAKEWIKYSIDKAFYNPHSWTDDFNGRISFFQTIESCDFSKDEIIVGVGMWASSQLGKLMALPNAKLQYIHGATPWDPELMTGTFRLSIPKVVVASYLKPMVESLAGNVLAVVPNGIDQTEYFPCVPESERQGIGTVFGDNWAKDPETIISVIDRIAKLKPGIPIRVFGTPRKPFRLRHCLYERYPSVEKARAIYSRSSVWFLASRSEGFGLPLLEAMACGCSVVATDCGGTRDIIQDGQNGFLVPVGDADSLVNRIMHLHDNDQAKNALRIKGDETVKEFSWQHCIDCLENVLWSLRPQITDRW